MGENVKIRIKEELEVAKRRLEAAKLLAEKGMIEDAVNRAYYTFFHAAKVMLNTLGYNAKTHSGLIYFRGAFEMRESSDYEIGVVFTED